ncbi:MAG TPA: AI-2E family transporter, partial [Polyangiaceae bacterium]
MQPPQAPDRRDSVPPLRIEVGIRTLALIPIVAAAVFVLLRLLPVLLALVVALFIVGTLNPAVVWLERRRVRRAVAIGVVFGLSVALIGGLLALTLPTLFEQFATLVREEPALRGKLVGWLARYRATIQLSESLRNLNYGTLIKAAAATVFEYSTRSLEIVTYFAASVFLALYMMLDRDRLRGGLFAIVPRPRHLLLSRIVINLEVIVGGYIRGQLLTSLLMAAFTFVLLTLCGVKGALAIGVIAGVADVLPYIGVLLSVGPAVAAAAARGPAIAI